MMGSAKSTLPCCNDKVAIPPMIRIAGTYFDMKTIPKCIVFILMWYITIFSFSLWSSRGYTRFWFLYLTHWSMMLCSATVTIRLASTISIYRSHEKCNDRLSLTDDQLESSKYRRLFTCQTVLTETALPVMTLVMIIFWTIDFKGSFPSALLAFNSLQTHVLDCVVMWVDYILSAEALHYKSMIWPIVFGTVYQIWVIIFEFAHWKNGNGEEYIYTASNWVCVYGKCHYFSPPDCQRVQ